MLSVEVTDCAVICEKITATEQLRCEINVTIILEETVVAQLFANKKIAEG